MASQAKIALGQGGQASPFRTASASHANHRSPGYWLRAATTCVRAPAALAAEREAEGEEDFEPLGRPRAYLLSCRYVQSFFGHDQARELMDRAGMLGANNALPAFVTIIEFWNLCLDNIALTNDEGQGCTRQPLPLASWGMIFSAVNQMDTIGSGLKRFAELTPLIPAGISVRISRSPERVMISYQMNEPASERGDRYLEILALVFHCILRWGTAKPIEPQHIRLSALLDDRDGSLLCGLTTNLERMGTGVTVAYAKAVMSLPLGVRKYQSTPHHETTSFLEVAAEIPRSSSHGQSEILDTLRPLLLSGPMSQQSAARRIGISVATLQRRLTRAGTSFRLISQEARRERLISLLRTGASLDDVAYDVGFSDRRSLCRACQQWLGMSPAAYRKLHFS